MGIKFSGGQWLNTEKPLNIEGNFTIEALLSLDGDGDNQTIFCLPISEKWESPYISYRFGFKDKTRNPVFEFLLEGNAESISIISPDPLSINKNSHMAATYDGKIAILYVDGKEVARKAVKGKVKHSEQPCVIGCRSKTDEGGYLVATLYELRLMKCIRTPKEIDFWKDTPVSALTFWNQPNKPQPPKKEDYIALWAG